MKNSSTLEGFELGEKENDRGLIKSKFLNVVRYQNIKDFCQRVHKQKPNLKELNFDKDRFRITK
jgi:hypothetical protein